MYIRHNIAALNTTRQLKDTHKATQKSTERLSTGLQINHAGDDAAGLSISEKMRAQIAGLSKASNNTQDSISLIQTADGALSEVHDMLTRGRELAIQAANDTNTNEDREKLQSELTELFDEINRIGQDTEFNTMKLFDGTQESLVLQVGANENQHTIVSLSELSTEALELTDVSISTQASANDAIDKLDKASVKISEQRAQLGAWKNGFKHTVQNVNQTSGNLLSADAVIRDANVAAETMDLTKEEILKNTMESVMTHSNMKNDWILNLLP